MEHAKKTFLEKHAAAMVCHRQEFTRDHYQYAHAAFDALADYADELAARVAELEEARPTGWGPGDSVEATS